MAIKVGNCDALPFINFLAGNGIPWGQDEEDEDKEAEVAGHNDGLRLRSGVMIENEMWIISHINHRNTIVVLVQHDLELSETMHVTIQEAIAGLI